MLLPLLGVPSETPQPKLIEYVIEQKEEETPKELTLEEKIATNHNNCDTDVEWIRADNAECMPKTPPRPQNTAREAVNASQTPSYSVSSGWFDWGWCTYYVSTQRPVGAWNNASEWIWQAQRDGWATGTTPKVGAVAQKGNHVAIVRSVSGNKMTIEEMNHKGFGVISSRTISYTGWRFIY